MEVYRLNNQIKNNLARRSNDVESKFIKGVLNPNFQPSTFKLKKERFFKINFI